STAPAGSDGFGAAGFLRAPGRTDGLNRFCVSAEDIFGTQGAMPRLHDPGTCFPPPLCAFESFFPCLRPSPLFPRHAFSCARSPSGCIRTDGRTVIESVSRPSPPRKGRLRAVISRYFAKIG